MTARPIPTILPLLALCASAGAAAAQEPWQLSVDAPAAVPVSAPQRQWFSAGSLPGAALHLAVARPLDIGIRLRAGALGPGRAPDPTLMDKGAGGFASLAAAVRFRPLPGGAWLEAAAGGAMTGRDLRPVAEIGVGWVFSAGRLGIGPSIRYLHVLQPDDQLAPVDAGIALVGIELSLRGRSRRRAPAPAEAFAAGPRPARARTGRPAGPQPIDGDGDRIVDADDACTAEAEVVNGVDDDDGCPDVGLFEVIQDRIAIEQQVLFDTNRARVKRRGQQVLAAVAAYLAEHPEFVGIEIEGHADSRGPEDYNVRLSRTRAERVGRALTGLGVAAPISVTGRGEAQPRDPGRSERAWRANRRVELFLVRQAAAPVSSAEVRP